ncbi:MAG: tetratricopeptide repeat protein [Chitinispirillaceae bacterium]
MKWLCYSFLSLCLFHGVFPSFLSAQNANCSIKRAREAIRIENYSAALDMLRECEQSPEVSAVRGSAYYNLYMADSAISAFSVAVDGGLSNDDILVKIGQAFLWKKNFVDADKYLRQVKDKTRLDYRIAIADRLEMMGKLNESMKILDSILKEKPDHFSTMLKKAAVLSWTRKFTQAITLYTQIIENRKAPKSTRIQAKTDRAEVLSWQKKFKEALSELDQVIEMDETDTDARLLQAQIHEWQGHYKTAKNIYKDILLIEPENKQAQIRLEKLLWVK